MVVVVACLALAACVAMAVQGRRRANQERRQREAVLAVAARLEPHEGEPLAGDLDAAIAYLGRAATAAVDRSLDALSLARSLGDALEAVPLGVVVTAPDGRVLFRNEAADVLLGTRASDALAWRALSDLLAEAAAGRSGTRPLDLFGPPRRALSLTAVPLGDRAAAVTVEDVSERTRLDAVRRDFVANVSHELKTPVAALGLLAETLAGEDDPAVVQRLAGRMQDEAFRVARIIDDLLDLSRLEAEEAPRHEPVRVQEVLAQTVEQLQPAAGLAGVALVMQDVPRAWTVLGDRRQLVSAMANLVENAVKYSGDGSTVEIGASVDGPSILLHVRDHGIGIPTRDHDRIFERFYRVDRGRGRDTGGTGLGLSIVRHIATNHGGVVTVASVEGEGSTFTLHLPAAPGPVGLVADAG
ncbi:MAG TPA: ATP-binding protein [Acidimicrobiales bacterium]|nr:ATP-binding protein [Acidimicrobiales bacterium]